MEIKTDRLYSESHEWVLFENDTTALIGVTDFAQSELGDHRQATEGMRQAVEQLEEGIQGVTAELARIQEQSGREETDAQAMKGKTETLKASTGVDTGMKGYEKETNCVVVTKGSEGYCKKDATAPAVSPAASVSPAAPVSPVSPANKK